MKLHRLIVPVLLAATAAGCTWTKLTPYGEQARILNANQVGSCKPLGTTTAQVAAKVIGIPRPQRDVERDLQNLARNALQSVNGDTIVPVGRPQDGSQTFRMYRCINP
ncbi:MAG: DUF4156 domain-containing protein [Acidihalobacter sp.]|jgi:hypothetical protein|uniref:DUF4156 domain-containing protein n=1 Tax=Acidihalobacter sp. TaxID=1872108 RepID=UPI00307F1106